VAYEVAISEAAHLADAAIWETITAYRDRTFSEEPAINRSSCNGITECVQYAQHLAC
jgi:hypothetical protein